MPAVVASPPFHVKDPKKTLQTLTNMLRAEAERSDWPSEVYMRMRVVMRKGELKVIYPSQLKTSIMDLEYGTESEPPRTLIRRIRGPFSAIMEKAYVAEAVKGLL